MRAGEIGTVTLGDRLALSDVVAVARCGAHVEFSPEYKERVSACRRLVERFSDEERVVYGVTTGLGDNVNHYVSREERARFQRDTILSHAVSVGEPLEKECVRAMILVLLQHLGTGHTGIRLETVEVLRRMLNADIVPHVPGHGSVGYLGLEGHIALVLIGEGSAWYRGKRLRGGDALVQAGIQPIDIGAKEGLSLVSGTTSVTALSALAAYDASILALTSDVIGAMSLEGLKGNLGAMHEMLMGTRPHPNQGAAAANVRKVLEGSGIQKKYAGYRVQDALSLRCIPQLHGAVRKLIGDSVETLEIELNSTVDNPQIFETEDGAGTALMGCNCDGAYAGTAADVLCIAMGNLAKMSERRLDRLVNQHVSELPAFLTPTPGISNGYMIPQYTAAGLLGEIRLKAHPATVDSVPTCALQEDYVSMGYNAAIKAYESVGLARYILAIELMNACQAQDFYDDPNPSPATKAVRDLVREKVPFLTKDRAMHEDMEHIAALIRDGTILDRAEAFAGPLRF